MSKPPRQRKKKQAHRKKAWTRAPKTTRKIKAARKSPKRRGMRENESAA